MTDCAKRWVGTDNLLLLSVLRRNARSLWAGVPRLAFLLYLRHPDNELSGAPTGV
jgi:hypothetical protein